MFHVSLYLKMKIKNQETNYSPSSLADAKYMNIEL